MFNKLKRVLILSVIFILGVSCTAHSVTRYEFLSNLLTARGLDWSESEEAQYNDAAGFILKSGYVTDEVENISGNVTRREVLRWCIQSLGLTFESELLSDYPLPFEDAKKLTEFERGCLVVATNMNPPLFNNYDDRFRGNDTLTQNEARDIYNAVRSASRNLTFDMVRNPLKGLRVFIHREGVPTGMPSWRVYVTGLPSKASADDTKRVLKTQGYDVNVIYSSGTFGFRTQKIDDFNQVRRMLAYAKLRKLKAKLVPSMTNTNMRIVPKFWVMLVIDPSYWKIKPIASYLGPNHLSPLSVINSENEAGASINAGFFAVTKGGQGYPIGALKIAGRLVSEAYENRGCLGWNDDDEAVFAVASEEANSWFDMSNIIQAGPLLIEEGMPSMHEESFNSSLISARHPRSAVGLTNKGEWVFLAVDGRNGMHSSGATISELTEIMRAKNIVYALNLDGGGSTEIIINGKIYNMPSDGYERNISYALGAVSR